MTHSRRWLVAALSLSLSLALSAGCGDGTASSPPDAEADALSADTGAGDAGAQDTALADTAPDTATDTATDAGPQPDAAWANAPEATEKLYAGAAFRSFHFPIGAPNVGLAPAGGGAKTRFNKSYPGTLTQQTDLGAKVLVFRSQGRALVMMRLDLIGVWDTMRQDVAAALRAKGRGDLAEGLLLSATHTHASSGRIMNHPILELAADEYSPGMYERVLGAMVGAVEDADAQAVPARFGFTTIQSPLLHHDRRCENGPLQDDSMGLIKVEAAEDGRLLAVVVNYAMHGTVLGGAEHSLSADAPGAVEYGVTAALPGAPQVLYIQSWAGDMAPHAPSELATQEGFDLRESYKSLDEIAAGAASVIVPALDSIQTTDTAEVRVLTMRFPVSMALANPDAPEFAEEYPYGGIYCVPTTENCPEDGGVPYTSASCLPFEEEWTIHDAQISAARLGELGIATLPGEPLTSIGTELRDRVMETGAFSQVFVWGYSQGYLSYLLHPDDFWMGGYEGASALLGPGGGQFFVDTSVAIANRLVDASAALPFEPVDNTPGAPQALEPLEIEPALGAPAIVGQPLAEDVVEATWVGGDPALGTPRVTLERSEDGGATFAPVLLPSGAPLTSDGLELELGVTADPAYTDAPAPAARTFTWTVKMPRKRSVPPPEGPKVGTFRFVIEGKQETDYRLETDAFTLE